MVPVVACKVAGEHAGVAGFHDATVARLPGIAIMATTAVKKILAEALALPGGERALLARELLASLDGEELDGEQAESCRHAGMGP
jgi:hypothetical protein